MQVNAGIDGSAPFIGAFFGDDIHHATDCVGPIKRRHRAADHLNMIDRRQWGHKAGIHGRETVWRYVAAAVLTNTVNQDQGIAGRHATDADLQTAGFTGAAFNIYPFNRTQGFT